MTKLNELAEMPLTLSPRGTTLSTASLTQRSTNS
jgi:hypothetical protein